MPGPPDVQDMQTLPGKAAVMADTEGAGTEITVPEPEDQSSMPAVPQAQRSRRVPDATPADVRSTTLEAPMQGPMERPMERARVLTSTLFETLFPAKEAKKREAWLRILLAEEFESLDDLAALDDAGWNSVALPLAIKTELRTASARSTPNSTQLAPDSHATLRDPSWGVRESAADGSTGVGPISFNVANELGRGRFGFVFLCTLSDRPGQYAVKRVDRLRFETEGGKKEIDVLLHAQATEDGGHRNVVHYIQRHTDSVHVYIVMELCDERLDHRMERKGLEDVEARRTACLELCRGLEYLHTLREPITHRDLKPSNLLFKKNCLKIADMGQSRILAVGETAAPTGSQVFYTCMYINAHIHARSLTRTDAHTHIPGRHDGMDVAGRNRLGWPLWRAISCTPLWRHPLGRLHCFLHS